MQVDTWRRGFSYSYDAPLDMRMDPGQELSAREIVNEWDERRLARLLREYGEERYLRRRDRARDRTGAHAARSGARLDAAARRQRSSPRCRSRPSFARHGHPAKRTFQALRMAVNDELAQLDEALPAAWELLATGGRLAAISFHSLEDRRVKHFLVDRARGCICPPEFPVCACGRDARGRTAHPPRRGADAGRGR